MCKRFIACVLLLACCAGGSAAHGEGRLPAFSRAAPAPAASGGLPAFSRPIPAATEPPAPTPRPTPRPTATPAPTPAPAVLFSGQGVRFEVTDAYFSVSADALQLTFAGVLTNESGAAVRVSTDRPGDSDGLFTSILYDEDAQGAFRSEFPSGGAYGDVRFYIEAKTAGRVRWLLSTTRFDLTIKVMDASFQEMFTRDAEVRDVRALSRAPEAWDGALVSGAGGGALIDVGGVRVDMTSVEIDERDASTFLGLTFEGAAGDMAPCAVTLGYFLVDGVEALGNACASMYLSEPGARVSGTALLMAQGGDRATFRAPGRIELLCFVRDFETRRLLFCAPATLYASDLRAAGNSRAYSTLKKGDEGFLVADLQRQLIQLNYLFDEADGVYGGNTAAAVAAFCRANGLPASEVADAAVQRKLFGLFAVAADEPDFALTFDAKASIRYQKAKGNKLKFRVDGVRNLSKKRRIQSFELRVYAEDAYGDPIYDQGVYYYGTTKKAVAPGKSVQSDDFVIPNRSDISTLYVGVSQFTYADGLTVKADPVKYWSWDFSGYF